MGKSDERCRRCGCDNPPWVAPSPLWNRVMRNDDINNLDEFFDGIVCPSCFIQIAEEQGLWPTRWTLTCDPLPDDLVYVTPSGRKWNDKRWMWDDVPHTIGVETLEEVPEHVRERYGLNDE